MGDMLTGPLNKKFQKIGIISKRTISEQVPLLKEIFHKVKKYAKEIYLDEHADPLITGGKGMDKHEIFSKADFVLVLGGDGTILKSAHSVGKKRTPILGVNMGTVGFLAEVMPDKLEESLKQILKNDYYLDRRTLLRITAYRKGKKVDTFLAMNDAVINQGLFARLIEMKIEIDQRKVAAFKADGLILATPTGSTGHSLSAGGPIVHPSLNALVITPICPITLSLRPIVIPNDRQVKITIATQRRGSYNIGLTVDGQVTIPLEYGDELKIRKSSRQFYMIRMKSKNYYRLLREKLGWGIHNGEE
jgi:NAD+ kinase